MTVADALQTYLVERGILAPDVPREDWYKDNWIRFKIAGRRVPLLPLHGFKSSFILHDVHHVLTGYETDWRGELEIAAWELGSGGCARYYLYWIDRLIFMAAGTLIIPRAMIEAFRRGREHRNLYARPPEDVLNSDLAATLRATIGVSRGRIVRGSRVRGSRGDGNT